MSPGGEELILNQDLHFLNPEIMVKVQYRALTPGIEQEVIATLIYKGRIQAMHVYIKLTGARLDEARAAVDRLALTIEPGPSS
ncbi:MAG: hypothetical protein NW241_11360 [Bacteroidia bacterium]|nr:hypothetical protein [Bacteroidia bacterium]